jgi:filamentous hemagglutinin family protein
MAKTFLRPITAQVMANRPWWAAMSLLAPGFALAGPTGGHVIYGDATIDVPKPNLTQINQVSDSAIINWQEFSVGGREFVVFNQPSASSAVLNRVIGGLPSEILGHLTANGRVFLINPQGVMFGEGAKVDVGSLVASTLDMRNRDFIRERYVFAEGDNAPASVTNAGRIVAGDGGFVVLQGDSVTNTGVIRATLGDVVLASGSAATLSLDEAGLVSYTVNAAAFSGEAGVDNLGAIIADGGSVVMTAAVAQRLTHAAVNNSGRVQARSIEDRDGVIVLSAEGGDVVNDGTLDVSGAAPGLDAGSVSLMSDHDVTLSSSSVIRANAAGDGDGGVVRIVAEHDAVTAAGSRINASAQPRNGGHAGFVELSGHRALRVRGAINLGHGGRLLIDPSTVHIADGSGGASSTGSSVTVFEDFIETQLQGGADVAIVATRSIDVQDLGADGLDGRNAGGGGELLLGIGSVSPSGSFGATGNPINFTRGPGLPGSPTGIIFANLSNAIRVDGRLRVVGGSHMGDLTLGDLQGSDVDLDGADNISVGNIIATGNVNIGNSAHGSDVDTNDAVTIGSIASGGNVTVDSRHGIQVAGSITANAGSVDIEAGLAGAGSITLNDVSTARMLIHTPSGNITTGHLTANGGGTSASFNNDIRVTNNGFSGTGSVTVGDLTLNSSGYAYLQGRSGVTIAGSSADLGGGTLEIESLGAGGTITFTAANLTAAGNILIHAHDNDVTGNSITASGDFTLTGTSDNAVLGTLGARNVAITMFNSSGGGSLTLNGVNASGSNVFLNAHRNVTINGPIVATGAAVSVQAGYSGGTGSIHANGSIDADQIGLFAHSGVISAGGLTANGGFRGSGDIRIDATGASGTAALGAMTLVGDGRISVRGVGGVRLAGDIDAGTGGSALASARAPAQDFG